MKRLRRWEVLGKMARKRGWRRMAEIGVFQGKTSEYLLASCPKLEMILVDHWTPGDPALDIPEHEKKTGKDAGYRSYSKFPLADYRRQVEALAMRYAGRATIIPLPSVEAAQQVEDGSLDCAFLDGDHTEAGVAADIALWVPKLKPDGLLTGHDHDLPAVARAIDRLLPGYEKHSDSVWSIHWRDIDPERLAA